MPSREIRSVTEIARGAGDRRHNGPIALHQAIKERAFARVRPTHNGQCQPVVHNPAAGKRSFQRGERRLKLVDAARNLGLRGYIHVVLGKVDARFKQRDQLHQSLFQRLHAPTERAAHLACGLPRLRERLRLNQIANSLGLGQIQLSGQKRALGKLARLGQPCAQIECTAQQQFQHHRRSVRRNLHQVFGSIRIGRGKPCHHASSMRSAPRLRRIQHVGQPCPRVLQRLAQLHKLRREAEAASGPLRRTMPMPPRPGGVEMAAIVSVAGAGSVIAWNSVVVAQELRSANLSKSFCKKLLVRSYRYNFCKRAERNWIRREPGRRRRVLYQIKASFN